MTTTALWGVFFGMGANYFYAVKGQRQGPVTLDQIKSLALRQELKRSDLVWTEGMDDWQPAGVTAAIFDGLPPDLEPAEKIICPPPLPTEVANISNIVDGYLKALKNYAVFDGRAGRREFWSFFFVNLFFQLMLWFMEVIVIGGPGILYSLYSLGVMIPFIAVGIRRMHDTDRSGWWVLLPIGNLIYWAEESKLGTNQFGPNFKSASP